MRRSNSLKETVNHTIKIYNPKHIIWNEGILKGTQIIVLRSKSGHAAKK